MLTNLGDDYVPEMALGRVSYIVKPLEGLSANLDVTIPIYTNRQDHSIGSMTGCVVRVAKWPSWTR
jgi:hypothetical protein